MTHGVQPRGDDHEHAHAGDAKPHGDHGQRLQVSAAPGRAGQRSRHTRHGKQRATQQRFQRQRAQSRRHALGSFQIDALPAAVEFRHGLVHLHAEQVLGGAQPAAAARIAHAAREGDVLQQVVAHDGVTTQLLVHAALEQQELSVGEGARVLRVVHARNGIHAHQHQRRHRLHHRLEPVTHARTGQQRQQRQATMLQDGHRGAQQLRVKFDVRVGEQQQIAGGVLRAHARGVALARPIRGAVVVLHDLQARVGGGDGRQRVQRAIGAAIQHEDHLERWPLAGQDAAGRAWRVGLLVVRRHDHRNRGQHRRQRQIQPLRRTRNAWQVAQHAHRHQQPPSGAGTGQGHQHPQRCKAKIHRASVAEVARNRGDAAVCMQARFAASI